MIEIKDLHKSFGSLNVLNGINEHISRGEKVVVIGPSGSGKSTFLRDSSTCWKLQPPARSYSTAFP